MHHAYGLNPVGGMAASSSGASSSAAAGPLAYHNVGEDAFRQRMQRMMDRQSGEMHFKLDAIGRHIAGVESRLNAKMEVAVHADASVTAHEVQAPRLVTVVVLSGAGRRFRVASDYIPH